VNAYLASRMVDERLFDDRAASGSPAARRRPPSHVDTAAWLHRSAGVPGPQCRVQGSHAVGAGSATATCLVARTPARRVRRLAGWLLIEAGLRLAVGRRAATLQG
jgi:hypothetical protein